MTGYLIAIEEKNFDGTEALHYCGAGRVANSPTVDCPNCGRPLFPALNLSFRDSRLASLALWQFDYAHVMFCPACALYMAPYFVHHAPHLHVTGGYRDGGEVIQDIDTPYSARLIQLHPMQQSNASRPAHQIGGTPPRPGVDLGQCPTCTAPMAFFGVLDYDDLNVPLYEDGGSPVALIIGDYQRMIISACKTCSILRLVWVL